MDAINAACAREKSIRHGHPSTLHLYWARRPLAGARAVIFGQMVDDPSDCPEEFPTLADLDAERERLFRIIEDLVKWENTTNEHVVAAARIEIWRSWLRTCQDNDPLPAWVPTVDLGALPVVPRLAELLRLPRRYLHIRLAGATPYSKLCVPPRGQRVWVTVQVED